MFSIGTLFLGWLLGAYLLGGYGPEGQGVNGFSKAMTATLKSWAVGIPVSILEIQYSPIFWMFAIILLSFTRVTTVVHFIPY